MFCSIELSTSLVATGVSSCCSISNDWHSVSFCFLRNVSQYKINLIEQKTFFKMLQYSIYYLKKTLSMLASLYYLPSIPDLSLYKSFFFSCSKYSLQHLVVCIDSKFWVYFSWWSQIASRSWNIKFDQAIKLIGQECIDPLWWINKLISQVN